jgi:hypothetical protein
MFVQKTPGMYCTQIHQSIISTNSSARLDVTRAKKERFVTIATKTVVDVLLPQFSKLQTQRHHYAT